MTKIQWSKMANQILDLPGINNVSFDENGEADVPENIAEKLTIQFDDLYISENTFTTDEIPDIESLEEPEVQDTKVDEIVEAVEQEKQDGIKDVIENRTTTVATLQQIAEQAGFPKDEWEEKKKAELRNYLIEKLNL